MAMSENEQLCLGCLLIKQLSEFNRSSSQWSGYRQYCRECDHKFQKASRLKPRSKLRRKFYRRANRLAINVERRRRRKEKREQLGVTKIKPSAAEIQARNKAKRQIYYRRNIEMFRAKSKKYRLTNRAKIKSQKADYQRRRRITDPEFALLHLLSARIRAAVRSQAGLKAKKSSELIGCSIPDFIIYLESKFEPGMSWDNYGKGNGKWEIDHIVPCAIFDLTRAEHQERCFHFSNMQPMWAIDNQRKGSKILLPAKL